MMRWGMRLTRMWLDNVELWCVPNPMPCTNQAVIWGRSHGWRLMESWANMQKPSVSYHTLKLGTSWAAYPLAMHLPRYPTAPKKHAGKKKPRPSQMNKFSFPYGSTVSWYSGDLNKNTSSATHLQKLPLNKKMRVKKQTSGSWATAA